MKTKSRNLIISFLLTLAMLLGVFAMTPLTASAIASDKVPAETIYVGGVELGFGQYVKNGETTATTGQPAEDATGFAWYTPDGAALVLVDYAYTGKGYEYSSGNYALVYSTGRLCVSGNGVNTLRQTQSNNEGIYSVGALTLNAMGTLTIEGDNCSCLYSNNEIVFDESLGTVNIKSTGNATAIVSYDNDGDAVDEEAIIVNGGDIYVETFYPISDLTINGGGFKVSGSPALSSAPNISAYEGDYTITVSENKDGTNPVTYNQDNISSYNYFRIAPPAKTVINSVSVSALDLPEIGESFVNPDETALTYGGEYIVSGCWIEKYTGTEWTYLEDTEVIEHSVMYRYVLTLRPNAGYTFSEDITDDNVKINGKDSVVLMTFPDDAFTTMVEVALEFSYEAPATDYGITIADKDDSGATVGVLITEENCTDVLGDGTVSYDPTTKTLTLNGYKYEGEGAEDDDIGYYGLMADLPADGLTIVLVGNNSITVSGSNSAGMIFVGDGDLTIKGDGSLTINVGRQGICLAEYRVNGKIKIDGGNINITATDSASFAIAAKDFVMTGGNLKINTKMFGFATLSADGAFCINGGSVEISTAYAGYAFIYADIGRETYNPIKPDLSGYVGAYKMTAGINADGSGASEFNEGYLTSYKYVNITEIESYGITIADKDESGATVGVLITEENYTDVLGDGTVSYDSTTNTLTLNGYKYEGSGFGSAYSKYVIYVPDSIGELNIVLEGENRIDLSTESDRVWACAIFIPKTDVIIKGNGSLVINSAIVGFSNIDGESDSSLEIKGGNITVNALKSIGAKYFKMSGGSLIVNAIGEDVPAGFYSYEFKMTGGNLKITSDGIGIEMWHESDEDAPPTISGGTFEISTGIAGGAFCYYNYDEDVCVAIAPDLTNYVGAYKMTAGANADGTSAVDYSASDIATYKFAKLESVHVHDYGTTWESDENNHWKECECGDKANVAPHADENNDGKCDTCDYAMGNADNPGGDKESEKTGLSGGAIAGIAVGSVAVAGLGGFSLFWFVIKKKKFADLIALFKKK